MVEKMGLVSSTIDQPTNPAPRPDFQIATSPHIVTTASEYK
jgi:hypothetical protein